MLRRARAVTVAVVVLTLVALGLTLTLKVDPDLLALLPDELPAVQALNRLSAEEGGVNVLTITVRGDVEDTHPFLSELQQRLEASERVDYAIFDIPDELAWRLGVLRLSEDELVSLRDRLTGALALGPAVANPFISARLLDLGPMTEKLREADARKSLMATKDMERLVVRPNGAARDLPFSRALMADVDAAIAELDPASRGVEIAWISGAYRFNVEDYEGIQADIRLTGLASVILVLSLLVGAFRSPRALFFVFTPLVCGTLWTFGFAAVAVGVLNTFTSVLGALLVGLGIDFSIHLFARFREERASAELTFALVRAWDRVGPPCLAAALTSAGGFAALMSADFEGFAQMGMLLAVGVMLCLFAVLTVLPLLLLRWPSPPQERFRWPRRRGDRRPASYRLAPMALSLMAMMTVVAAMVARKVEFEYDLSELRRDGQSYEEMTEVQQELTRLSYNAIIASHPDDASLRATWNEVTDELAEGHLQHVGRVTSIYSVLPQDQDRKLALLREIAAMAGHENYGYLPPAVRTNLDRLTSVPLEPLTPEDLPRSLRHLVGAAEGRHRMMFFPSGNVWDLREVYALKGEVERLEPNVPVAGEYMALGSLYQLVRHDAPLMGILAALLVALGTFLDLRKPGRALGAISVLAAGMVWSAGAIVVAGVKLSIINIVGVPILLGIGVDVVIHLAHRLAEEGPGRVLQALSTTGWAAGLSSATTVLSFTALVLATNQGIRSLGMLVLVGLSTVTIAAFVLLPLGFMTIWRSRKETPFHREAREREGEE